MVGVRRRFFTILSALSLLLCGATCAMWVRSYRHGVHFTHDHRASSACFEIISARGVLGIMVSDDRFFEPDDGIKMFDPMNSTDFTAISDSFRWHSHEAHCWGFVSFVSFTE